MIDRRRFERTTEFKDKYRVRGGSEATNSIVKQSTGLDRVRGRPAVFSSILLKAAGWNILQAARAHTALLKLAEGGIRSRRWGSSAVDATASEGSEIVFSRPK